MKEHPLIETICQIIWPIKAKRTRTKQRVQVVGNRDAAIEKCGITAVFLTLSIGGTMISEVCDAKEAIQRCVQT